MPKEIYIKNIKRLNNEIKSTSAKMFKLQKNRDDYYKKNTGKNQVMDKNTMKQFEKIVKERPQLIELAKKNVKAKREKRKNQDLLMKAEKKGLI